LDSPSIEETTTVNCQNLAVREINQAIWASIEKGVRTIRLLHPGARHNLGVGLPEGVELRVEGSAGYYVGGLNDGATVLVHGGAGWGAGESMRDGTIVIDGNVGNAVAASIRAGTVVVRGDSSTRAGIAMKGGMLIVAGHVGAMAGFMMQKGMMIVCGHAGPGLADSMYAGTVFLGGVHGELGADAVIEEVTQDERDLIGGALERYQVPAPARGFRKIVSARRLWNFTLSERELWKSAL
jgi:glutamate synthase domain-containing protein 3